MARFVRGGPPASGLLGILPAAFNPVTNAHLALAELVDCAAFVLPEQLPHKDFDGATFDQRLAMLEAAAGDRGVIVAEGGLVHEIVDEIRRLHDGEIAVLCGSDAAERYLSWDYGEGPAINEQLEEYRLIVADRGDGFRAPSSLAHRIQIVDLPPGVAEVSSTEVRGAIAAEEEWRARTPRPVAELIARWNLYR